MVNCRIQKFKQKLKSNVGVSLVEVLMAFAISMVVVSLIVILISFCNRTLAYGNDIIDNNGANYDGSYVLSRYVRESKYISAEDDKILIQVPETLVGGNDEKVYRTVYLYLDKDLKKLCLDTNGSELGVVTLADDVTGVKFTIISNGLGYIVKGEEGIQYYGFAYKRAM